MLLAVVLGINMMGCGSNAEQTMQTENTQENMQAETNAADLLVEDNYVFKDNDALYEEDNDTSVVTMYLTVSMGNESENTNHTWTEINSHDVYYYEEKGIERYKANALLQVGDENGPLEGELGYNKYTPNATVNVRGQTSSRGAQKNYKIELKDEMGKWNDQQVINLNKHQSDGTRFYNKLCYDLMEELPGMMALQTQFVHLYVKDETMGGSGKFEDYGLYTQVEQPNKSFLERHGLDKNGHLYKINEFEFYRYEDVIMQKSDMNYDEAAFEKRIEVKGDEDHSKLIQMLEDLNDYSIPIETILEEYFDIENMASWMAFHILVGNIDTQSRNTLIYSPLNGKKWYFISWDNDGAFQSVKRQVRGESTETGWEHGVSNYWGNVLFQRALKSEVYRKTLHKKIVELRSIMNEEKITGMINAYAKVVKPYAFGNVDKYYEPFTIAEYNQACKLIPKTIEENYQIYQESLTEPMPFFIGVPRYDKEEIEFVWGNSYDFENQNIFYSFELADNLDFNRPIVKEENMFVPEYNYEGKLKPGQYFIRVKAVNEEGKEQYAFDYYVDAEGQKHYGTVCFYVLEDGIIGLETYEG